MTLGSYLAQWYNPCSDSEGDGRAGVSEAEEESGVSELVSYVIALIEL